MVKLDIVLFESKTIIINSCNLSKILVTSSLFLVSIPALAMAPAPNPYIRNSAESFYLNCAEEGNEFVYTTQTAIDQHQAGMNGGLCQIPTSECQENPGQYQCNEIYLYMNDIMGVKDPDTIYIAEVPPAAGTCSLNLEWGDFISCLIENEQLISQSTVNFIEPTPVPENNSQSGSSVSLPKVIFSGEAYPGAVLSIKSVGDVYSGQLPDNFTAGLNGNFSYMAINPLEERRVYYLNIKDRDGNSGNPIFFSYDLKYNSVIYEGNILFAPTLFVNKTLIAPGESIYVSGYAFPDSVVEVLIDSIVISDFQVSNTGMYSIVIDTTKLIPGDYKLQTRQTDAIIGKTSDLTQPKIIKISSFAFSGIDFNKDTKINIQDWSIFLSNWSSDDESKSKLDDLNQDGKTDIGDFSVFLSSFQLVQ